MNNKQEILDFLQLNHKFIIDTYHITNTNPHKNIKVRTKIASNKL